MSSKEQIEGTSLETQEAACRNYAQSKNLRVLKVFVEHGESAKFADRTQLLELIDFSRQSNDKVDALLVWKIDRFARNVADHYSIKTTLLKYGVRVVSVTEPIDSDPTGKLMEGVLASVAQFDNDVRAMRTVQGMRKRIHDGIFPWGAPLGYKSAVTKGEKKNLPDVPIEPAFGILQRAWRLLATAAYTQAEMGRLMESWGLTSTRNRRFGPQSLHQLFTNPYYKGVLIDPWDGLEYEGKHRALVTKAEFACVQAAITRRNRSFPHQKDRPDFPLRGFVRCEACHHPLTGACSRGRSKRYPYYMCQVASCPKRGKSLPAGDVHKQFEEFLDSVSPHPDILERVGDFLADEVKEYQTEVKHRTANRKALAEQLDRELQELIRMRAQSLITDQEFLSQRKTIADQRDGLENNRSHRTIDVAEMRSHFEEIALPLVQLRQTWLTIQPPFRRRFERLVLPVGFTVGQTRTAELGGLFRLFQGFVPTDSSVVAPVSQLSNLIIPDIQGFWRALNGLEDVEEELAA